MPGACSGCLSKRTNARQKSKQHEASRRLRGLRSMALIRGYCIDQALRARTFGALSAPPLIRQTLLNKPSWDTQQDARPLRVFSLPAMSADVAMTLAMRTSSCVERWSIFGGNVEASRQPSQSRTTGIVSLWNVSYRVALEQFRTKYDTSEFPFIFRSYLAESTRSHSEFGS